MALLLPAHMETIKTSLARFHVTSAGPDVILHADRPWWVAELDLTVLWYGDLAFLFSFSFGVLGVEVFDHRLGRCAACIGLRFWSSCTRSC